MTVSIFFVLNGLLDGERGVHATQGEGEAPMADGWWFLRENADRSVGPFVSRDDAKEASAKLRPEDFDPEDVIRGLIRGRFTEMMKDDRMAYADAGPRALIGMAGPWEVVIDINEDGTIHCEAHGGDCHLMVDLARMQTVEA